MNQTSRAWHLELMSLSCDIFRLQKSKFDNLASFWFAGNMSAKSIQQVQLRSKLSWMCKPWHTKQFQTKLKATIGFFNHTILLQSEVPNCLTQPSLLPPRLSKFQLFEAAIAANHQSSCGRLWYWSTLSQRVTSAHVDWKPGRTYDWRKPKKTDFPEWYSFLHLVGFWDTLGHHQYLGQKKTSCFDCIRDFLDANILRTRFQVCKKQWPGHWDRDYGCAFWELSIGTIPLKPTFSKPTRVQSRHRQPIFAKNIQLHQ